jgi:GT2 family glycosyltransferase
MPGKNRAIVVLGMHRSGTSAFAGVLSLLGVDLGSKLLAASATNQSGYWEHGEVVAIHDQLLMALGSSWDDPAPLPEGWLGSELVAGYSARLLEIVRRDFGAAPLWALKDPRLCRLLPLWIPLLEEAGCEPVWVLVERHPAESIRSLEKRDGLSREKSELLWLKYTLDAERETRNRNRVVITMDQLLDGWEETLGRVSRAVGAPWPVPTESAAAQVREFLDPGKRHHRVLDSGGLSQWTRDTHDALVAGAQGDEAKMSALLAPVQAGFGAAEAMYWPFIRARGGDIERSLVETNQKYGAVFESCEKFKEKHLDSKAKLAARTAELKARKEQIQQFERSPGGKLNRLLGRMKAKEKSDPVDFLKVETPDVSIIVSAAEDISRTSRCLRSVREKTAGVNYEVIAVGREPGEWKNVRLISNEHAAGFGEAHNKAARQARGEIIVFLDDSALVEAGWLEALLEPLRSTPRAGAVGAEGGMLERDGSVVMLAAQDSGELREADFCTTACLAMTKNLFFQVGGFDRDELPVEEINFGLKIRRTGRKMLVQPRCPITNPERTSDPSRLESVRPKLRRWAEAMAQSA